METKNLTKVSKLLLLMILIVLMSFVVIGATPLGGSGANGNLNSPSIPQLTPHVQPTIFPHLPTPTPPPLIYHTPTFNDVKMDIKGSLRTLGGLEVDKKLIVGGNINADGQICAGSGENEKCIGDFSDLLSDGTANKLVKWEFNDNNDNGVIDDGEIVFGNSAVTEDDSGNVGIGTDNLNSKLEVAGDINANGQICNNEG